MTTYAYSVNHYDRYTNQIKKAEHLRFDNVFGAHVTSDPKRKVSDLELLQYIASIATPKEREELARLSKNGFNIYNFQAQLITNPVFKENLIPMLSQAAMQEAREPGSSYIYRNDGMQSFLRPQLRIYQEKMPFHSPAATLQVPFLRRYVHKQTVPLTVKTITEPSEGMTPEALLTPWNTEGFKEDHGVWKVTDNSKPLTDLQAMQLVYNMADAKEKAELTRLYKERGGYSLNMFQADLVSNPKFKNNLITKLSLAAQAEARNQGSTALYTNPTLRNLYNTQKRIYDKAMGDGQWEQFLLGTPGVNFAVARMPMVGIIPQTRSIMTNPNKELSWENIKNTSGRRDEWDELPENHNGGGDIEYVAPALAIGAPIALLGGMQGGIGAGIGLLGLAGIAGYGYGYGKTQGWKGWDWADKVGDSLNNMLSGKKTPKAPTGPEPSKPEVPKAPATH